MRSDEMILKQAVQDLLADLGATGVPLIQGGTDTEVLTGDAQTVKRWATELWVELPRVIYWNRFMRENDMNAIIEWLEAHSVLSLSDNWREFLVQANQIYFVSLPGWFLAAILYIVVSAIWQRGIHETRPFRVIGYPSNAVGAFSGAPGILNRIAVIAPPYVPVQ